MNKMIEKKSIFDGIKGNNEESSEEEDDEDNQTFFQKITGCFKQKK